MEEQRASSERIIQFLKDFVPDQGSPTGEENVNIQLRSSIVGSYHLHQADIYPEVLDWVLSYLDQKKCPCELSLVLSTEVATYLRDSFPIDVNKQDPEAEFMLDSVLLYNNVIEKLLELCDRYQNTPDEILSKTAKMKSPMYLTSVSAIKNTRRKMEDRHIVIHDLNAFCGLENSPPHSYYAVFDGHAGVDAASYAASHLHWNIVKHPAFATDLEKAIKEAYVQTDEDFLERSKRDNVKSGCTAVTCLIRDKTLYVAWLGDSLAILVRQGMPISLVEPHKPDRPEEQQRIKDLGGMLAFVGTWRVNGTLAVSRAIGDIEHKPMVSSDPDIHKIQLEGNEDFLVIGCDGLWDNMSPQDVSATVYSRATDLTSDVDSIASSIVQQSKNQGSTDNITAIVVLFRDRVSLTQPIAKTQTIKENSVSFDSFTPNGKIEHGDFPNDGPFSNNPFSQNWMDNPTESLESGKSIYVYNSGITVGDPIGANGPEEIFRPFSGVTLERTSTSELPTPPIEDLAPTQQFSNLESLNSRGLEQAQISNPFSDDSVFSGSSVDQNVIINDNTFDLLGGALTAITSESQSSLMVSSQVGQSLLTSVPECDDQILSSKPWVMQVEHSLIKNDVDYLPGTESSEIQNAQFDFIEGSTLANSEAPQLYDFSGTINLEEVPLDGNAQVNLPLDTEIEVGFLENKSFEDGQNQDLVSSLSEEAHSTLRAIHGVQEMIGISESVPVSKAQDPPATAGNPFSDNPFTLQKNFDDDLPSPVKDNHSFPIVPSTNDFNFDQQTFQSNVEALEDLGPADIDLIESNVDPEDETFDQEIQNKASLPDVTSGTTDTPGEVITANDQDLSQFLADNLTTETKVEQTPDLFQDVSTPQVPIVYDSPNVAANIEDCPNIVLESGSIPQVKNDIISSDSSILESDEQKWPTQEINMIPSTPTELNFGILASETPPQIPDSLVPDALTEESLTSDVCDVIPETPSDSNLTTQFSYSDVNDVKDISKEAMEPEIIPDDVQVTPLDVIEDVEVVLGETLVPVVETSVSNIVPEDANITQNEPQNVTIAESTLLENTTPVFTAEPESVKVEFSPTLSSEPAMSILSPIIGAVTGAEIPSAQDTLSAPVLQLGKIPDGVPEADGVTEDVDSDSEKDGGWSYVKGSDGKPVEKLEKKDEKASPKMAIKKAPTTSTPTMKKPIGKVSKPEDKTKKTLTSTISRTTTSTVSKKSPTTQSAEAIKKPPSSSATLKSASPATFKSASPATLKSASPAISKIQKTERPKSTSGTTTAPLKSSKTSVTNAPPPKPSNSTLVKNTSTSTLRSTAASKTVTSTTATSVPPKLPARVPPAKSVTETVTLNKTSRPITSSTLAKSAITKTSVTKTAGTTSTMKASTTRTTASATSTLSKTASATTTKSSATLSRPATTGVSKVIKKPTTPTISTSKMATEVKQTKETVIKQITRTTGTVGKTASTLTTKTSTLRNASSSKPTLGNVKPKSATGKTDTGIKSVPKPIKKTAGGSLMNGNAQAKEIDPPNALAVAVEGEQLKEGESIKAPMEPEKGSFEENNKEMPAVDSGLASPESLESPQNGLASSDSNVTNSASMQNDKNEIVFNQ